MLIWKKKSHKYVNKLKEEKRFRTKKVQNMLPSTKIRKNKGLYLFLFKYTKKQL